MAKRKWIGLVGRAGVGKDYTCEEIMNIDPLAARIALADGVRLDIEAALWGQRIAALWDKPYPNEIRRLLQWWGTDLRREQDAEYWVTRAEQQVAKFRPNVYPVFTDIRFENEAAMIRNHGGILVRVVAHDAIRRKRLGQLPPDHVSETEQDAIVCDWQLMSEEGNAEYRATLVAILMDSGFKRGD